ncbi:hypothetical protein V6Z11_D04G171500 [Gossypium hirsutum]
MPPLSLAPRLPSMPRSPIATERGTNSAIPAKKVRACGEGPRFATARCAGLTRKVRERGAPHWRGRCGAELAANSLGFLQWFLLWASGLGLGVGPF